MKKVYSILAALVFATITFANEAPYYKFFNGSTVITNPAAERLLLSSVFVSGVFTTNNTSTISLIRTGTAAGTTNTIATTNILVSYTTERTLSFVDESGAVPFEVGTYIYCVNTETNDAVVSVFLKRP